MKHIISWNVNGIRALNKKGLLEPILKEQADILLFQEIKASEDQLDREKSLFNHYGYTNQVFSSSLERKGHSSVALVSRETPSEYRIGLISDNHDRQGRLISAVFGKTVVINAYVPNGGSTTSPLPYKLEYLTKLLFHVKQYEKKGYNIILLGDMNVAHTPIDLARPKENIKSIGFLPEERAILDTWFNSGFIDCFRFFNPHVTDSYTYWDQKTRARERNVGWRIDYGIVNDNFIKDIQNVIHRYDILGSDHCPLDVSLI